MSGLLGLPRFGGPVGSLAGYVIVAMAASLAMHLLRLGWERKFGAVVIDG